MTGDRSIRAAPSIDPAGTTGTSQPAVTVQTGWTDEEARWGKGGDTRRCGYWALVKERAGTLAGQLSESRGARVCVERFVVPEASRPAG